MGGGVCSARAGIDLFRYEGLKESETLTKKKHFLVTASQGRSNIVPSLKPFLTVLSRSCSTDQLPEDKSLFSNVYLQ